MGNTRLVICGLRYPNTQAAVRYALKHYGIEDCDFLFLPELFQKILANASHPLYGILHEWARGLNTLHQTENVIIIPASNLSKHEEGRRHAMELGIRLCQHIQRPNPRMLNIWREDEDPNSVLFKMHDENDMQSINIPIPKQVIAFIGCSDHRLLDITDDAVRGIIDEDMPDLSQKFIPFCRILLPGGIRALRIKHGANDHVNRIPLALRQLVIEYLKQINASKIILAVHQNCGGHALAGEDECIFHSLDEAATQLWLAHELPNIPVTSLYFGVNGNLRGQIIDRTYPFISERNY